MSFHKAKNIMKKNNTQLFVNADHCKTLNKNIEKNFSKSSNNNTSINNSDNFTPKNVNNTNVITNETKNLMFCS